MISKGCCGQFSFVSSSSGPLKQLIPGELVYCQKNPISSGSVEHGLELLTV